MSTTSLRRCSGSARFGIEAHEAPAEDFPVQPSRPDGLGRMCKPHWREYTAGLRKAALDRSAGEDVPPAGKESTRPKAAGAKARMATPMAHVPTRARQRKAPVDAAAVGPAEAVMADATPAPEMAERVGEDDMQRVVEVSPSALQVAE